MALRNFLLKITGTFFYIGYLPFIPGTFGSLAGLILYFYIKNNIFLYCLACLILLVIGFLSSGAAAKLFQKKDPRQVVIDEVAGMLLSFAFLPFDLRLIIAGFFVFRLLDTLKPYPASRLDKLHGSIGIMGDDIIAGIYTNLVLQVLLRLLSIIGS